MPRLQTSIPSDWRLSLPKNVIRILDQELFSTNSFEQEKCPFYAPFIKNGKCRLCNSCVQFHRLYYLNNFFSRKIQRAWKMYKIYKLVQNKLLVNDVLHNVVSFF